MTDRSLFKVTTKGCGDFYVVAFSWSGAAKCVERKLEDAKYGYSEDRVVLNVELVRMEHHDSTGKQYFYGDEDIRKLIICEEKEE